MNTIEQLLNQAMFDQARLQGKIDALKELSGSILPQEKPKRVTTKPVAPKQTTKKSAYKPYDKRLPKDQLAELRYVALNTDLSHFELNKIAPFKIKSASLYKARKNLNYTKIEPVRPEWLDADPNEKPSYSIIAKDQVAAIKWIKAKLGWRNKDIASALGVHEKRVSDILLGKTHKNVYASKKAVLRLNVPLDQANKES